MTLGTDVVEQLLFTYPEAVCPNPLELVEGTPEDTEKGYYWKALENCKLLTKDVMTEIRQISLQYPNDETPTTLEGFMTLTRCSNYAASACSKMLQDLKRKPHIEILLICFDVPGETVKCKETGYDERYKSVLCAKQSLVDEPYPFRDELYMPAPLNTIFKNKILKEKLLNYIIQFLIRNYLTYILINHHVIIDGLFWNNETLSLLGIPHVTDIDKVKRDPMLLWRDQKGLHFKLLSHSYVRHVGEGDLGAVYWILRLRMDAIVSAKDGDLFWAILMCMDANPYFENHVYLKKPKSIRSIKVTGRKWTPGKVTASGINASEFSRVHQECAFYYDMQKISDSLTHDNWFLEENEPGVAQCKLLEPCNSIYNPKIKESQQVYPVPLFVALASMSGNDYNRKIPQNGFKRIFDIFSKNPSRYRRMICKSTIKLKVRNLRSDSDPLCCRTSDGTFVDFGEDIHGEIDEEGFIEIDTYGVVFSEYARFIHDMISKANTVFSMKTLPNVLAEQSKKIALTRQKRYANKIAKRKGKASVPNTTDTNANTFTSKGNDNDEDDETNYDKYIEFTLECLHASAANLAWSLGYWANGSSLYSRYTISDPLSVDENGKPYFGWEKNRSLTVSDVDTSTDITNVNTTQTSDSMLTKRKTNPSISSNTNKSQKSNETQKHHSDFPLSTGNNNNSTRVTPRSTLKNDPNDPLGLFSDGDDDGNSEYYESKDNNTDNLVNELLEQNLHKSTVYTTRNARIATVHWSHYGR